MTDDELRLLLVTLTPREIVDLIAIDLPRPVHVMARFLCNVLPEPLTELTQRFGRLLSRRPYACDDTRHIDAPFLDAVEDLLEEQLLLLCGFQGPTYSSRTLREILTTLPRNYLHPATISDFNAVLETLLESWPRDRHSVSRMSNERWSQLIVRSGKALSATPDGHGTAEARYVAYGKILDAWLLL